MKRFIQGSDRNQLSLLPERLNDYIGPDNPVRVIDVFVQELDLGALGFAGMVPMTTGRPSYHPAVLLKVYLYGYLNRIQSSRRLERETQRNVEVMWLTGPLMPDFKTLANFRKDNGAAIAKVGRLFIALCRKLRLFCRSHIAIDDSKFKAVNHCDRNFTSGKVRARMEQIQNSMDYYLDAMETADRIDAKAAPARTARLQDKLGQLRQRLQQLKAIQARLRDLPDGQLSLTDPDARSMATSGCGTGMVGYNVQTAVDTRHHLIVAHEVTNMGNDRGQLAAMAEQARVATGIKRLAVVADRGYYKGEEILQCHRAGVTALVPKPLTSASKAEGRFGKQDFAYVTQADEYRCPANERLIKHCTSGESGMTLGVYWSSACGHCPIKAQCTSGKERRIKRWEHEAVLDAMQRRLERLPHIMRLRRQTAEHPFGTIKAWMGATHFLTRTIERVRTEMSLHVLAYNLKRVMQVVGIGTLIRSIRTQCRHLT